MQKSNNGIKILHRDGDRYIGFSEDGKYILVPFFLLGDVGESGSGNVILTVRLSYSDKLDIKFFKKFSEMLSELTSDPYFLDFDWQNIRKCFMEPNRAKIMSDLKFSEEQTEHLVSFGNIFLTQWDDEGDEAEFGGAYGSKTPCFVNLVNCCDEIDY